LSLCVLCIGVLFCSPAQAQLWDMLTKPQITVSLVHPPRLGLNIKKVAFGPAGGRCSDEILDRLSGTLINDGVEVVDRQHLHMVLAEQHLGLSGYVDQQSAVRMGRLLGPTALIFVKISRCDAERSRNYTDAKGRNGEIIRTNNAIVQMHIRGSLQTVDLATGRIFSASPIVEDTQLVNSSDRGMPEHPSEDEARDKAVELAAYDASTMFVRWTEQKKLYFFNDKDCNLSLAYAMLKANDFDATVRQSETNLATCKTFPNVKDSTLAHAYYNAGLSYLLVNDNGKAIHYLNESAKLKGGDIVTQTILEANKSAQLDEEMRRVAEKTDAFEQSQADMRANEPPPPPAAIVQPGSSAAVANSPEERLKKIDSLYKKGLITKPEYDAKKKEILKDM
jgi:hypothetical protein